MRLNPSIDPLRFSLLILTAIVIIAGTGLALNANWPKLLRVTLAAAAYIGVLAVRARSTSTTRPQPWWPFACAGALAGVISGIFQPSFSFSILLASAAGGTFLLGTVHWLAVRNAGSLRSRPAALPSGPGNLPSPK
jgi:uncharacterized membrane protein YfcA